ncbi:DGQHR domain-containing protein [Nitratidesulfovibrio liaohensis]|uniref:DGQHR domain-containing protein n=1 Tax=Nitratidesulfovibrio liaohensis TaxID=2604158 RepID=UPI001421B6C2|nr:DGQHR domain-containing protein [Nitratidesulfovibrio liaohensis]NHZ47477.1 DGQHR domain-containing protein [Nitratidesulfovibrio liaohensis]
MKKQKNKKRKLTHEEKEQRLQQKEVYNILTSMGFRRAPKVDGKEFTYSGRTSEIDDIFFYENVILIVEYTLSSDPGGHLKDKVHIYQRILSDPPVFIDFLMKHSRFGNVREVLERDVLKKYEKELLQVRIVYVSKNKIPLESKGLATGVKFFDYEIVKYFDSVCKAIKRSARYDFFAFLDINASRVGDGVFMSAETSMKFKAHVLPNTVTSFAQGFKLVTFYVDAESLLKRAYVLRKDGWREVEHVGFYQRMLGKKKISSMRKYLSEEGRVFINNIIVTLPSDRINLEYFDNNGSVLNDSKEDISSISAGKISIEDGANTIGIIDGQHRLFAYHEGDDAYEEKISKLRSKQLLLATGIVFPSSEGNEARLKFEAKLFLEINSNQQTAGSKLKQEIESALNPFSAVSIATKIITKLNENGPLAHKFETYWFESNTIKTASVVSFGLRPLLKFSGDDSLYSIWDNPDKENLLIRDDCYELLDEYRDFCVEKIRNVFIGLRIAVGRERWTVSRTNPDAILNVTTVNGIINCLRLLVKNNKIGSIEYYSKNFETVKDFGFKKFKSSQYSKMGKVIYDMCFADRVPF